MSERTTIAVEPVADTITRQVRYDGGWKNHHSVYLLSLHPLDRDALVDALPQDVLLAMSGVSA